MISGVLVGQPVFRVECRIITDKQPGIIIHNSVVVACIRLEAFGVDFVHGPEHITFPLQRGDKHGDVLWRYSRRRLKAASWVRAGPDTGAPCRVRCSASGEPECGDMGDWWWSAGLFAARRHAMHDVA